MKYLNSKMIDSAKSSVEGMSTDAVLNALGLQRRSGGFRRYLPSAAYLLAGFALGAGVALLVAPKNGRQTRKELGDKAKGVRDQLTSTAEKVTHDVQGFLGVGEDAAKTDQNAKRGNSPAQPSATPRSS